MKNGEEILRSELEKMQHENSKQNEKITDLTERLKSSMQMDMISQSQELITLKADLANSLKLEYADYLNSLTRIFRTLRRFGIMID